MPYKPVEERTIYAIQVMDETEGVALVEIEVREKKFKNTTAYDKEREFVALNIFLIRNDGQNDWELLRTVDADFGTAHGEAIKNAIAFAERVARRHEKEG